MQKFRTFWPYYQCLGAAMLVWHWVSQILPVPTSSKALPEISGTFAGFHRTRSDFWLSKNYIGSD